MIYIYSGFKSDYRDFIFGGLQSEDIEEKKFPYVNNTWTRRFAKKLLKFNILGEFHLFPNEFYSEVNSFSSKDVIVLFGIGDPEIIYNVLQGLSSKISLIVWLWNTIGPSQQQKELRKNYKLLQKKGVHIFTFDEGDSERYGIQFIPQFYRFSTLNISNSLKSKYDFYYLGSKKGKERDSALNRILSLLPKRFSNLIIYNNNFWETTYSQNIVNISESRCIIDVVSSCQKGLSLRPMEALAFHKKLLTTNANIMNYDFYRKENIFVLGVDKIHMIDSFLNSDYVDIPNNILMQYDVNTWFSKLIGSKSI